MQGIRQALACVVSAVAWLGATQAEAASPADRWPSKPIQMIVPQAPGGTNDIVARLVAADLSQRLGQQVVVENRPGAGGNIGTQFAARATPNGYTLLMTISSTQAINPSLYRQVPFDPIKDFEPIAPVATVPNVLVVNPAFPAKTLPELIAMAKAKPGQYRFASAGNGTLNHLLGEMLNSMAGIQLEHVPYKGVAPALNDVLGNQVPMAFASLPSVLPHIKAGKVRALGVSSAKRSPFAPDIPAIGETVPGYSGDLWVGLFAVKGTPNEITQKLAQTMQAALADPALREKLGAQGAEALSATPQQFAAQLKGDLDKWARIVKASGAQVD
ncbi:Bug family tripartite tricarboxylate transporter substrate binding protein [Cupriavidus gilardii]|uniref:Bug family tripartite tricarboxylate transporter substrate binding protein n=1 Tax=Cupriavidus gilardii TaxID=82541 RepID=UPI001573CA2F|nr:tripartite tricarboxylate transporter substrate binding protein [Cupriavidus gilardii]NSX05462.1 tripartite tricarboxylate transporter substrate binding protein [Cupriavidus gilardii]